MAKMYSTPSVLKGNPTFGFRYGPRSTSWVWLSDSPDTLPLLAKQISHHSHIKEGC